MNILETERLNLREWTPADLDHLKAFLQDEEVMYAYEHAFSDEEVHNWLEWNLSLYQEVGYGLWAIETKTTGEIIGECGLTNQKINGEDVLEIGYHLNKASWGQGFAIEAAQAVKEYAFETLAVAEVVSVVRDTNLASMNVAIRNGMTVKERFVKQYYGVAMPHYLFAVEREKNG